MPVLRRNAQEGETMSEHNELVKAAQSTIRKMEIWGVRRGKTITKTKEWVITLEVEARRAATGKERG